MVVVELGAVEGAIEGAVEGAVAAVLAVAALGALAPTAGFAVSLGVTPATAGSVVDAGVVGAGAGVLDPVLDFAVAGFFPETKSCKA